MNTLSGVAVMLIIIVTALIVILVSDYNDRK